jgi:hypothetical protein
MHDSAVPDGRAQSLQIGAILLFAILIVAFSLYQAFMVPTQNSHVEFKHNQQVQDQLLDLRGAVVSVPSTNSIRSVAVSLGVQYPGRGLGVNPPSPSGSLRTHGTSDALVNVSIENATASGAIGDFWNGTARDYSTGSLVYRPNYNEFRRAPTTTYQHSILVNDYRAGSRVTSTQTLIDGRRIRLVVLNGTLRQTARDSVTVDVSPLSASETTVAVTNESDGNVTISVPTTLSETDWNQLLEAELTSNGGYVRDLTVEPHPVAGYDRAEIELAANVTYQLQLARAGVGTSRDVSTSGTYLVPLAGNGSIVPEGETQRFRISVRDRLNNPVSGEVVEAATTRADSTVTSPVRSDDRGRVELVYTAPSNVDGGPKTDRINVSIETTPDGSDFDATTADNVSLDVTIANADGSGTSGGGTAAVAAWENVSKHPGEAVSPAATCSQVPCEGVSLTAETNPARGGLLVAFWTNDSSVASFSNGISTTNTDGKTSAKLEPGVEGTAFLNVSADNGQADDRLTLETDLVSGFEGSLGAWEHFGDGSATTSTAFSNQGSSSAFIDSNNDGGIRMQNAINTSQDELLLVEYWGFEPADDGPEAADSNGDEDLVVEYLVDGGDVNVGDDWKLVDRMPAKQDGIDEYERRARINASAAMHDDFRIRFRQIAADTNSGDRWFVDDVTLTRLRDDS